MKTVIIQISGEIVDRNRVSNTVNKVIQFYSNLVHYPELSLYRRHIEMERLFMVANR